MANVTFEAPPARSSEQIKLSRQSRIEWLPTFFFSPLFSFIYSLLCIFLSRSFVRNGGDSISCRGSVTSCPRDKRRNRHARRDEVSSAQSERAQQTRQTKRTKEGSDGDTTTCARPSSERQSKQHNDCRGDWLTNCDCRATVVVHFPPLRPGNTCRAIRRS